MFQRWKKKIRYVISRDKKSTNGDEKITLSSIPQKKNFSLSIQSKMKETISKYFDFISTQNYVWILLLIKEFRKSNLKSKAMTRTIGIYTIVDMIQQFKTHVWAFIEYANGTIMHTIDINIRRTDDLQSFFIRRSGISPKIDFIGYNFASPLLRRDIGMLRFVHISVY